MPYLRTFNPFVDKAPSWPLPKLDEVAYRASRRLVGYPLEDLRRIAEQVAEAIDDEKALYVETETESYVRGLIDRGGWELRYFPGDPDDITESSVRWLLENWPSEADESPSLPQRNDLSDIDALQQAIDYDHFQNPFRALNTRESVATDDAVMVPLFALLSLMKVEEALEALSWGEEGHKWLPKGEIQIIDLASAAHTMAEACEALFTANVYAATDHARRATARHHLEEARKQQEREVRQRQTEREARAVASRERALAEKNARFAAAQDWVWDEWQLHQAEYQHSRVAFARTYVRLVAGQFKMADGDPMKVSERTIWEKWTKGPRSGRDA